MAASDTATLPRTRRNSSWIKPLPYVLLAPATVLLVGLFGAPFVSLFGYSLTTVELSGDISFVGLANFASLVSEQRFRENMLVALVYLFGVLALSVPVAYGAAILVTSRIRAVGVIRTLLLTPWVLAPVVTALLFRTMVDPTQGPIAAAMEAITGRSVNLVSSGTGALLVIILHGAWRSFPLVMLLLAAAISAIPRELYDAAKADGANAWAEFRHLTLPMSTPTLVTSCIIVTVFTLQDAESIYALTKGGPGYDTEAAAVRLFKEAFLYYNVGGGAAIGVVLVVLTIIVLVGLSRISRRMDPDL